MKQIYSFIILIFFSLGINAQCTVNPSFISPTSPVCTGNPLSFINTTVGNNLVYSWDFAAGDLASAPTNNNIPLNLLYADGFAIAVDNETDSIYGFASDLSGASVTRLTFGNDIDNSPILLNIASIPSATGSDFIKVNNNWYGFVCSCGNSIYRLDFGSSLSNIPSITQLVISSNITCPYSIVVREDSGKFYGFVGNFSGNVTRLDFDTITNISPPPTDLAISGLNAPGYLTIKKFCNKWVGLISNYFGGGIITQITFDSTLNSTFNIFSLGALGGGNGAGVDMIEEDCNIYGFVSYDGNSTIYELSYGNMINNTPTVIPISGPNGSARALRCINVNSKYRVLSIQHAGSGSLTRWAFPNNSGSNYDTSSLFSPNNIIFNQPGTYNISLTATDTINGDNNSVCGTITIVQNDTAYFGIPTNINCSNTFTFTDSSSPNNRPRLWDFGDGNTSIASPVTHVYSSFGSYNVTLTITSANGCTSSYSRIINADSVAAAFTFQGGCTDSARFFSSDTSQLINYKLWKFGDGNTDTIINPAHSYAISGTYNVWLIVGINGCLDSIMHPVTFYGVPKDSFNFSTSCVDSSIQFTNFTTSIDTPLTYNWRFGDGGNSIIQNPVHSYLSTGNFSDTLICTSLHGCKDTLIRTINVSQVAQSFIIYSPTSICGATPVSFHDTSSLPIQYHWNFDNLPNDTSNSASPVFQYSSPGIYIVKLITRTGTSCIDSTFDTLTVTAGPTAHFTFDSVCLGFPTQLNDSSIIVNLDSINSSFWTFPDTANGAFGSGLNYLHLFDSCGFHQVIHTVISIAGCVGTDTQLVYVFCPPVAQFSYIGVCSNEPISFFDNSSSDSPIISWHWDFGDGNQAATQNPTHIFASSGHFLVTLTITNSNGCVSSVTDTVNIPFTAPTALFNTTPATICFGTPVQFNDYSQPQGLIQTWSWNFGDGSAVSNLTSPTKIYSNVGVYIVSLTVTSTNGCTSVDSLTIIIHPVPVVQFTNTTACVNYPIQFIDDGFVLNNSDSIAWSSWTFDTNHFTFGDTAYYTFTTTGNHIVILSESTWGGCSSTIIDTLNIQPSPIAGFTFSPLNGSPPLEVTFSNTSTNANSYLWTFGDGDTSIYFDPVHIYKDTNCDTIKLIVTDTTTGCKSLFTDSICLNHNILDIAVDSVIATPNGDVLNVSAIIKNKGSEIIYNYDLEVNVAGNSILVHLNNTLNPEGVSYYTFNQAFAINQYSPPPYVCVIAKNPNGISPDDNPANDEQCASLLPDFQVINLFPNPTLNTISVEAIVPLTDEIKISLYDDTGQLVTIFYDGLAVTGFNKFEFNTSIYSKGIYLLSVEYKNKIIVNKLIKL